MTTKQNHMNLLSGIKTTTLMGLALLATSCTKLPPSKPMPIDRSSISFQLDGHYWRCSNLDANSQTYELAVKRRFNGTSVETVYYTGNFKDEAMKCGDLRQLREMTPQMQQALNEFADKYATFVDATKFDVYQKQSSTLNNH